MTIETQQKLLYLQNQIYKLENSYMTYDSALKLHKLKTILTLVTLNSENKIIDKKFNKLLEMLKSDDQETIDLAVELINSSM